MHTKGEWHTANTGNHQGLICSYTGENIAIAYDKKDAPILSAAPDLLQSCKDLLALLERLDHADTVAASWYGDDETISEAQEAIAKAE